MLWCATQLNYVWLLYRENLALRWRVRGKTNRPYADHFLFDEGSIKRKPIHGRFGRFRSFSKKTAVQHILRKLVVEIRRWRMQTKPGSRSTWR